MTNITSPDFYLINVDMSASGTQLPATQLELDNTT